MSGELRQEVLGLLATPLTPAALTTRFGSMEPDESRQALTEWLRQVIALSPALIARAPTSDAPEQLCLEVRAPCRGSVRFMLTSGQDLRTSPERLVQEALAEHREDLLVLVLCADVTDDATCAAVRICLQAASRTHDDRLLVMEPGWSAGILVERIKPFMPGDLNLASRLPATIYFDGGEATPARGIGLHRADPAARVTAFTDSGVFRTRLEEVQKRDAPEGPIYLCTTFLPPVTHSPRAVERFYEHQGATESTIEMVRQRRRIELETWTHHVERHQRIDVIDRGQLEEYLAAPEYHRMPLTPAELAEQLASLESLLAHDNYLLCLTPEAIDIPFEIREEEVRIRPDRRNKGRPRQGRITSVVLREPQIHAAFEREFWSSFRPTEPEFLDKAFIMHWLRERAKRYRRDEASLLAAAEPFDVFLCHNTRDKPAVRRVARRLVREGLRPWFDEWHAPPGRSWYWELEKRLPSTASAAVFIGQSGLGPWQRHEVAVLLEQFVRYDRPVIPVLLRDADEPLEMPGFLRANTWIDLRRRNQTARLVEAVRDAARI